MTHRLDEFVNELQEQVLDQARAKYSDAVVTRWMNPSGHGSMTDPDGHARVTGPCGDSMEIFLRVEGDRIARASFLTDGCMTTIVSASMAVELATGKSVSEAGLVSAEKILAALGGLPEDSQHCALLAANTLRAALNDAAGGGGEVVVAVAPAKKAKVNSAECLGCAICADVCPEDAVTVEETAVVDLSRCTGCGECVAECPEEAVTLVAVE